MQVRIDRRMFLVGAGALAGAALWPWPATGQQRDSMKLILLGTGGGPRPRKTSSAPAQVILINDTAYVVDCGDGVARQLVFAGVPLPRLRHVFLTHHHSDHNADYGNLILLAWTAGLRTRVDAWGPPPLEKMTQQFFEMNAYDIATRTADEGRVPLAPLVHVHELSQGGPVMQDENVKVSAALVNHPPVIPAFGYRFDARDRSSSRGTPLRLTTSSSSPRARTSWCTTRSTCPALIEWSLVSPTRRASSRASCRTTRRWRMRVALHKPRASRRWFFHTWYPPKIQP